MNTKSSASRFPRVFLLIAILAYFALSLTFGNDVLSPIPVYAEPEPAASAEPVQSPVPSPAPAATQDPKATAAPGATAEPATPANTPPPLDDEGDDLPSPDPMGKRPFMIALLSIALVLCLSLLVKVILTPTVRRKRRKKGVLRERPLRKVSHRDDLELIDYYHPKSSPLDHRQRAGFSQQRRREDDARIRTRGNAGRLTNPNAPHSSQRGPVRTKASVNQRMDSRQTGYPRPQPQHTQAKSIQRAGERAPRQSAGGRSSSSGSSPKDNIRQFPGHSQQPEKKKKR